MDFTKPEDGTFAIAPQYLFDYMLKYSFDKHYKINPIYTPKLVPELEYDNYGRTDEEKFFLVANEKVCTPTTTERLYECLKKYPDMGARTNNVRDFLEYITGGFDIWTGEHGTPNYLEGMRQTLEDSAHTFAMLFVKSHFGPVMEGAIADVEANRMQSRNFAESAIANGLLGKILDKHMLPPFVRFSKNAALNDFRNLWACEKAIIDSWNEKYKSMIAHHNREISDFAEFLNSHESRKEKSCLYMNIREMCLANER